MTAKNNPSSGTSDREIVMSRVFAAPRELVWQAWTDPKQVVKWWGPNGFSTTIKKMDFRVGGVWEHVMRGPDGANYPNKSMFREIVPLERIVYSHGGGREDGPGASFMATWTFEDVEGGKTKLTGRLVFPSSDARDFVVKEFGAIEGGKQTLGKLNVYLATIPIIIERTYAAPIELVWRAITDFSQMKQWYMTPLEAFEPKVGFQTQFNVHHNGKDFLHLWKVTDVVPGTKITYSWRYDGFPGESFVTFELAAEGAKTRLKLTHDGLGSFLPDKNPDLALGNFFAGWTALATQLQVFLEKAAGPAGKPFVISREFAAPRGLVWKVWTEVEHMKNWFGPRESAISTAKMDFRPGGMFHYCMQSADGKKMWGRAVYREINAPERIVWVNSFSDEAGGLGRHPMAPTWPQEMLTVATFAERPGRTTVTIEWTPLNASDEEQKTFDSSHDGMNQGWSGSFDRLAGYLAELG